MLSEHGGTALEDRQKLLLFPQSKSVNSPGHMGGAGILWLVSGRDRNAPCHACAAGNRVEK